MNNNIIEIQRNDFMVIDVDYRKTIHCGYTVFHKEWKLFNNTHEKTIIIKKGVV